MYAVTLLGAPIDHFQLSLPILLSSSQSVTEGDNFYISDSAILPDISPTSEHCLFVCCGDFPVQPNGAFPHTILYISGDALTPEMLLMTIQNFFNKILRWFHRLQEIVAKKETIYSLVESSIPIFDNRVVVVDPSLRVLAYSTKAEESMDSPIVMGSAYTVVPKELAEQFQDYYISSRAIHEPFTVPIVYQGNRSQCFCINMFSDSIYLGTCGLHNAKHPLRTFEQSLFRHFASACENLMALKKTHQKEPFGIRSYLGDLLHGEKKSEAQESLFSTWMSDSTGIPVKDLRWRCLYAYCKESAFPSEYIAYQIEQTLPCSYCYYEEEIIYIILVERPGTRLKNRAIAAQLCKELSIYIGISRTFSHLPDLKYHAEQAKSIGNYGIVKHRPERLFLYEKGIVDTILEASLEKYPYHVLFTENLMKLRTDETLWITLQKYLANECNASQTAKELFVHRSTLMHRLEKIKEYVLLDTPEDRLYLRICIHIANTLEPR